MSDEQRPIEPVKLQKMIYISYGWCWALLKRDLFSDEIQAWELGPVIPSVWHEFKDQGREIKTPSSNIQSKSSDENTEKVLDSVHKVYASKESYEIVAITHARGTPWSLVYDGTRNKEIPKHRIRRYYELLHDERKKSLQK